MTNLDRNPGPQTALAIIAALAVTAVALCGLMVRARAQSEPAETQAGRSPIVSRTTAASGARSRGQPTAQSAARR